MTHARELSRRSFLTAATIGSMTILARGQRTPDFRFSQYHNQTAASPLHQRMIEMWAAIREETGGRVETQVFPENNKNPGSDPAVLQMLVSGEIEFFTLMGGILGNVVPAANVQQVPFAFRSAAHAHTAIDGPLGTYLRGEMAAKGIVGFAVGTFDNGMRQIAGRTRPIRVPADLAGLKVRVPDGKMFDDIIRAFGAEPVTVNSSGIYAALKAGTVDAQENPLAYMDLFRHYEVMKYVSMTNHMWSGFNLLANQAAWNRIPLDIRAVIERQATKAVRLQRLDQEKANTAARGTMAGHGLAFNDVDSAPFRAQLSGVYAAWKNTLGARCWSLLEAETGRLA
ncbi:MAG: TRAP transporter substrate-binding protein [Vicinamibacterales bacterium]